MVYLPLKLIGRICENNTYSKNLDNSYGGPTMYVPLLVKYLNNLDCNNMIFSIHTKKKKIRYWKIMI